MARGTFGSPHTSASVKLLQLLGVAALVGLLGGLPGWLAVASVVGFVVVLAGLVLARLLR